MTVHLETLVAILLMTSVTYLTRLAGYALFSNRELSSRTRQVMDAAPGCVLIAVIAPYLFSGSPADLIALALTALTATRFSLLPTVIVGVASAGLLRAVM